MAANTSHIVNLLHATQPTNSHHITHAEKAATTLVAAEEHAINDPLFQRLCIDFSDEAGNEPDHDHSTDIGCCLPNDDTVAARISWRRVLAYLNESYNAIPFSTQCVLHIACSMALRGFEIDLGILETLDRNQRRRVAQAVIACGGDTDIIIDVDGAKT